MPTARLLAGCLAIAAATPASAQTFVDVFAGRSFPERAAGTLIADEARVDGTIVPAQVRVDVESLRPTDSTIFGARVGHWFGWFGLAVDAATLDPDVDRQTIRTSANLRFDEAVFGEVITIDPSRSVSVDIPRVTIPTTATVAALAMVRLPRGGVQPYAFAGPAYLVTDSDLSGKWGLRAGGGLRLAVSRTVALFGEYRYTDIGNATAIAGRIGGTVADVRGSTGDIRARFDVRNHSAVGGIGFSF